MKFCESCGVEIATRDGENRCTVCEGGNKPKRTKARSQRKARESVLESLGLVKVRGALGGVYWECRPARAVLDTRGNTRGGNHEQ